MCFSIGFLCGLPMSCWSAGEPEMQKRRGFDVDDGVRIANRLFGFTAQRTLEIAQKLYERRKLLSYPRTDSKHLSQTIASMLPAIALAIAGPYRSLLAEGTGERPLGPRFVDDARVSDHHAILPTETEAPKDLPPDERKIYDLVCRRLLQAWHGDHVYALTSVTTEIVCEPPEAVSTAARQGRAPPSAKTVVTARRPRARAAGPGTGWAARCGRGRTS
jgi:DNA topoisomerase IA